MLADFLAQIFGEIVLSWLSVRLGERLLPNATDGKQRLAGCAGLLVILVLVLVLLYALFTLYFFLSN